MYRRDMSHFIGVDVGTGSVRAALVQSDGVIVKSASKNIKIWNPQTNFYQQSSKDIWSAVIETVKVACSSIPAGDIGGIGFDATCSLVVLDTEGQPLSVCPTGDPECDIIMWMDHRAGAEAEFINSTNHQVLKHTGGAISLEMELPKLLWIKKNLLSRCWDKSGHYFDLCDFLTWRATGSLTRSLCSVVSKWTYMKEAGFDKQFFDLIGLGDLCQNDFQKIGNDIQPQGQACGAGLTTVAASELGLKPGTSVGVGMIDAHCGTIGCIGSVPKVDKFSLPPLSCRLAMISGTSTCHMAVNENPIFVDGVWGPFWSSIIPGLWATEGGQSAAGKLIDFVVETHPAYADTLKLAQTKCQHIYEYLHDLLEVEAKTGGMSSVADLTRDLHMWPDYHGNRSPLADHNLKGMISGLTLQSDSIGLAVLYLATVQALAYGTRHIISEMTRSGHVIKVLYVCGGLRKNQLYVQAHADITGLPVIVPDEEESVLLGAAILGATAGGLHPSIQECMQHMCGKGEVTNPDKTSLQFHNRKYQVFLQMYQHQRTYQHIMDGTQ